MKHTTKNIYGYTPGNVQEDAPRRVAKRRRSPRRILRLVLLTLLVLAIVTVALLWDATAFDGLRRSIIYARAEKDETGCALLYQYESDKTAQFSALGGSLISLSTSQVRVLNEKSELVFREDIHFMNPCLVSGGETAAAYDTGGTVIYVLHSGGLRYTLEMPGDVIDVTVNRQGYLTAVYRKSGCKAAVSVYDTDGAPVFEFFSAERFVMTAALSDDGRTLCAVTMGQESGVFTSFLTFYRTNSTKSEAETTLEGIVYALEAADGEFCAVTEQGVYLLDQNGRQQSAYSFGSLHLRRCCVSDGGYSAVLLSRYRSGGSASLITVDEKGDELGGCAVEGEVLDISAAGRYVAVLYSDRMVIYDKFLEEVAVLEEVSDVRCVLMRSDGSAVIPAATTAGLYLP